MKGTGEIKNLDVKEVKYEIFNLIENSEWLLQNENAQNKESVEKV